MCAKPSAEPPRYAFRATDEQEEDFSRIVI
jgi:hypothetical protein